MAQSKEKGFTNNFWYKAILDLLGIKKKAIQDVLNRRIEKIFEDEFQDTLDEYSGA